MYSLVMLAAMTTAPEVPQALLCPVTPSKYGGSFWLKHCFYDCCGPARYGWVNCWNKGFGYYPGGGRGFCGGCATSYGHFYQPTVCGTCCTTGKCGFGGWCGVGGGGCNTHTWCGLDWSIGCKPAYYTSITGCGPCVTAPPYARYTQRNPCCTYGHFAFDSGLIGHSSGVGYAGFSGYGNFGFYGAVPMQHPPTTADIPRFVPGEYHMPTQIHVGTPSYAPLGSSIPMNTTTAPTRAPSTFVPNVANPGSPMVAPPVDLIPKAPNIPPIPVPEEPKKIEKSPVAAPSTVVLNVPSGSKVFVETHLLKGESAERTFRTPNLEPGQDYVYTVKAFITIAGSEHEETKQVTVKAGQTTRVNFEQLLAKVQGSSNIVGASGQK